MKLYYYVFVCAYFVSITDLKEKSAPQEYAFMFVFVIDVLLFVSAMGITNIFAGYNLFNATVVILCCLIILFANYLIFLRKDKYIIWLEEFKELRLPEYKKKRVSTMFLIFLIAGSFAIVVVALNNFDFGNWLIQ